MPDPDDEFRKLTEGLNDPDPDIANAEMAAVQVGAFWAGLKRWGVPDASAEWLTKAFMELGSGD